MQASKERLNGRFLRGAAVALPAAAGGALLTLMRLPWWVHERVAYKGGNTKGGCSIDNQPRFAHLFYKSNQWKRCRQAYLIKQPLCERCGRPAEQVHHKVRLTPQNIKDPSIALSFDNLEALCFACHQNEHKHSIQWRCDQYGHVEL